MNALVPGTKAFTIEMELVVADNHGMKTNLGYLAAGYGLTVAFALALQFLPPVIPVMRTSLGMSASQAGTLMSSLAVLGVVVSPLVGYVTDRWGGRAVGLLGIVLLLVTEAWFALSRSYASLLLARLCMGTGSAVLSILGAQIISEHFTGTKYLGAAMGTMNTAVPLGILASQLAFAPLAALGGWQAPVWVCLAFTLLFGVVYLLRYHDPAHRPHQQPSLLRGMRQLDRRVWALGTVWMLWNAGSMVILTFANDLLVSRGLSLQAAGGVAALLMLFPITASTAMGYLLDRYHLQNAAAAAACLLLAACVILLGTDAAPAVPLFIAMSVAMALAPSAVFARAPYLMRDQQSGLGYGVLAGMLNIGVALGPVVAGAAKDATGSYLASCVAAAVLEVLGALAVLLLRGVPRTEAA